MARFDSFDPKVYEHPDEPGAGAEKRREFGLQGKDLRRAILGEFKRGTLRSGSGKHVTSRKQAIRIALEESRRRV